jgi:hypothetical protein
MGRSAKPGGLAIELGNAGVTMGTVVAFPQRMRMAVATNERDIAIPAWALPGILAIAWSQAVGHALLYSLPERPRRDSRPTYLRIKPGV